MHHETGFARVGHLMGIPPVFLAAIIILLLGGKGEGSGWKEERGD